MCAAILAMGEFASLTTFCKTFRYVIAEILQHYYPKDIELPEYRNGDSLPTKVANWHQLELFFKKKTKVVTVVVG